MDAETPEQELLRVLMAGRVAALADGTIQRIVAAGGEAIVVASAAEAKRARGPFDRGVFAFDLPDGSGIVLAAELILENRIRDVRFELPHEELATTPQTASDVEPGPNSPGDAARRREFSV